MKFMNGRFLASPFLVHRGHRPQPQLVDAAGRRVLWVNRSCLLGHQSLPALHSLWRRMGGEDLFGLKKSPDLDRLGLGKGGHNVCNESSV